MGTLTKAVIGCLCVIVAACLLPVAIVNFALHVSRAQSTGTKLEVKPNPNWSATSVMSALQIYDHDRDIMSIDMKGNVTFGKGVTPNEAAKQFVKALRTYSAAFPCGVDQGTKK